MWCSWPVGFCFLRTKTILPNIGRWKKMDWFSDYGLCTSSLSLKPCLAVSHFCVDYFYRGLPFNISVSGKIQKHLKLKSSKFFRMQHIWFYQPIHRISKTDLQFIEQVKLRLPLCWTGRIDLPACWTGTEINLPVGQVEQIYQSVGQVEQREPVLQKYFLSKYLIWLGIEAAVPTSP